MTRTTRQPPASTTVTGDFGVSPEEAELWDVSGTKGLKFIFDADAARALATGRNLHASEREQHVRVR